MTASWTAAAMLLAPVTVAAAGERPSSSVALADSEKLWGRMEVNPETGAIKQWTHQFPGALRLPAHYPANGGWRLDLKVERLMAEEATPARRQAEDVGFMLARGRVQVWFGGEKVGGCRITAAGRTVANNPDATLAERSHRLGVAFADGELTARLDGQAVLTAEVDLGSRVGPIDLVTRNSTVRWSAAVGAGLTDKEISVKPWQRRPGEPRWNPEEAILNGYQPLKSHLWNRWLGNLLPPPGRWPRLPWIDAEGKSPVTHGPLLGKPSEETVAVWCRTREPTTVAVVGGPGDDPTKWDVLGKIRTTERRGNTGHLVLHADAFDDTAVGYTLRVDGKLVDLRENGKWPRLRRRWFHPSSLKTVRLAAWTGDNLFPVPSTPYPPTWRKRQRNLDLMVQLGDIVYEQTYRRRVEVSSLDYKAILSPFRAGGKRQRHAPLVATVDDHEFFNDMPAAGEPHLFREPYPYGAKLTQDVPWKIASRDVGWKAWERYVGWGTPAVPEQKRQPILIGRATLTDGGLTVDQGRLRKKLDALDPERCSTLIIWPDGQPRDRSTIRPKAAGVYRVASVDASKGHIALDPSPPGDGEVRFSVSRPRYGSIRVGPAEVLLMDTRTARTFWHEDPTAEDASMLGDRQRQWLLRRIRRSDAEVLLLASSVSWKYGGPFTLRKRENWRAFQHERGLLFQALRNCGKPVVILSGNLHNAAVRRIGENIWEVLCGSWSNKGYQPLRKRAEPVPKYPDDGFLWVAPEYLELPVHWAAYTSLFTVRASGAVKIEMLNLARDQIAFTTTVADGDR